MCWIWFIARVEDQVVLNTTMQDDEYEDQGVINQMQEISDDFK